MYIFFPLPNSPTLHKSSNQELVLLPGHGHFAVCSGSGHPMWCAVIRYGRMPYVQGAAHNIDGPFIYIYRKGEKLSPITKLCMTKIICTNRVNYASRPNPLCLMYIIWLGTAKPTPLSFFLSFSMYIYIWGIYWQVVGQQTPIKLGFCFERESVAFASFSPLTNDDVHLCLSLFFDSFLA